MYQACCELHPVFDYARLICVCVHYHINHYGFEHLSVEVQAQYGSGGGNFKDLCSYYRDGQASTYSATILVYSLCHLGQIKIDSWGESNPPFLTPRGCVLPT